MVEADVTRLLQRCREGEGDALEELLPLVYDELHRLAEARMRRERGDHTLQATALVHEAWLKLVDQRERAWENRNHFLAIAATAMRRILVNHAHGHRAAKRGGDRARVTLDPSAAVLGERADDLLALDEALTRMADEFPDKARLVELRFFAGLTHEEIAEVQGVSVRTVERGWRLARAWLRRELSAGPTAAGPESA